MSADERTIAGNSSGYGPEREHWNDWKTPVTTLSTREPLAVQQ